MNVPIKHGNSTCVHVYGCTFCIWHTFSDCYSWFPNVSGWTCEHAQKGWRAFVMLRILVTVVLYQINPSPSIHNSQSSFEKEMYVKHKHFRDIFHWWRASSSGRLASPLGHETHIQDHTFSWIILRCRYAHMLCTFDFTHLSHSVMFT